AVVDELVPMPGSGDLQADLAQRHRLETAAAQRPDAGQVRADVRLGGVGERARLHHATVLHARVVRRKVGAGEVVELAGVGGGLALAGDAHLTGRAFRVGRALERTAVKAPLPHALARVAGLTHRTVAVARARAGVRGRAAVDGADARAVVAALA